MLSSVQKCVWLDFTFGIVLFIINPYGELNVNQAQPKPQPSTTPRVMT